MNSEPSIPWPRICAFMRQHVHDMHNGLNLIHLEAEMLQDGMAPGSAAQRLASLSRQLQSLDKQLRSLAAHFHELQPLTRPTAARTVLQVFQSAHAALPGAPDVQWMDELGDQQLNVDTDLVASVFRELLRNAAAFSPDATLTVIATASESEVIFELREPKPGPVDPAGWGQPFVSTRYGGSGLGLWTAHRLLEANGGTLTQNCAHGCLISRIALPLTMTPATL